jgi:hypothetical protein
VVEAIGKMLNLAPDQISIKAGTNEDWDTSAKARSRGNLRRLGRKDQRSIALDRNIMDILAFIKQQLFDAAAALG